MQSPTTEHQPRAPRRPSDDPTGYAQARQSADEAAAATPTGHAARLAENYARLEQAAVRDGRDDLFAAALACDAAAAAFRAAALAADPFQYAPILTRDRGREARAHLTEARERLERAGQHLAQAAHHAAKRAEYATPAEEA